MLELTADNLERYLRDAGRIDGPAEVAVLAGGVSNVVFRVSTSAGRFVVKQSRPQLRTREAWFSDVRRIFRESEAMQALADALPESALPRVLWEDRATFAFAMSHAPDGRGTWKEALLAGDIDPERGAQAGMILGRMHEFSARHPERFRACADRAVFVELRVDPFYRRVMARRPDVAPLIEPLVHDLLTRRLGLCHGDFTPKNLLLHDGGMTLVDYETCVLGDPAFDLGLFLAHLALKSIRCPDASLDETIRRFETAYAGQIASLPLDDLMSRGRRHRGACLLARVDGTSPVDYLDESQQDVVRAQARALLGAS